MAEKDPDVAAFWAWCKERAAKRAAMSLAETRASFDTDMGRIPLADNVTAESLSFGAYHAMRPASSEALSQLSADCRSMKNRRWMPRLRAMLSTIFAVTLNGRPLMTYAT